MPLGTFIYLSILPLKFVKQIILLSKMLKSVSRNDIKHSSHQNSDFQHNFFLVSLNKVWTKVECIKLQIFCLSIGLSMVEFVFQEKRMYTLIKAFMHYIVPMMFIWSWCWLNNWNYDWMMILWKSGTIDNLDLILVSHFIVSYLKNSSGLFWVPVHEII